MSVGVIVALRGAEEAEVAAAIGRHPDLAVARRCADLTEAVAAAQAGVGGVLLLAALPGLDRAVIRRVAKAGVAIVGRPDGAAAAASLAALGVTRVLSPGLEPDAVAQALADGETAPATPSSTGGGEEADEGVLVAVWGPTGAPGRTSVAVNVAAESARRGVDTVLADADTYGGAIAPALGISDEAPGIAALARAALRGELTDASLSRHAVPAGAGLRVLTGIPRPDRWPELPAAALEPLWALLRSRAALTVVDCGFSVETGAGAEARNAATLSALEAADAVVVVGSAEPIGVQRLVQAVSDLGALAAVAAAPRLVVVNRVRASVAGSRAEEAVADALARYANVPEIWPVAFDARAFDAAARAGAPLADVALRSPARRAIQALADGVIARVDAARSARAAESV